MLRGTCPPHRQHPTSLPRHLARTFVLAEQQGGSQPSVHDGLLVQDGGGGGRELGRTCGA